MARLLLSEILRMLAASEDAAAEAATLVDEALLAERDAGGRDLLIDMRAHVVAHREGLAAAINYVCEAADREQQPRTFLTAAAWARRLSRERALRLLEKCEVFGLEPFDYVCLFEEYALLFLEAGDVMAAARAIERATEPQPYVDLRVRWPRRALVTALLNAGLLESLDRYTAFYEALNACFPSTKRSEELSWIDRLRSST